MKRFSTVLAAGVVATTVALLPLSASALAVLTTNNKSDAKSTVMITSGPNAGKCATDIKCPFGIPCGAIAWTPAHAQSVVPWNAVIYMCTGSFLGSLSTPCTAKVYSGDDIDCKGKVLGDASMDANGNVTVNTTDSNYTLTGGSYQMTIEQK